MPTIPPRQAAFRTRRTWLLAKLATSVTVLTAATAVVIVAAAAVAFTITWGITSAVLRHRPTIARECAARHRTIMIAGYMDMVDVSALTTADVPVVAMARRQHRCVA
jgi:hypothetical protein